MEMRNQIQERTLDHLKVAKTYLLMAIAVLIFSSGVLIATLIRISR